MSTLCKRTHHEVERPQKGWLHFVYSTVIVNLGRKQNKLVDIGGRVQFLIVLLVHRKLVRGGGGVKSGDKILVAMEFNSPKY